MWGTVAPSYRRILEFHFESGKGRRRVPVVAFRLSS
jgi:hypothetical protein